MGGITLLRANFTGYYYSYMYCAYLLRFKKKLIFILTIEVLQLVKSLSLKVNILRHFAISKRLKIFYTYTLVAILLFLERILNLFDNNDGYLADGRTTTGVLLSVCLAAGRTTTGVLLSVCLADGRTTTGVLLSVCLVYFCQIYSSKVFSTWQVQQEGNLKVSIISSSPALSSAKSLCSVYSCLHLVLCP